MNRLLWAIGLLLVCGVVAAETQTVARTGMPPLIDGLATEAQWSTVEWHPIDQLLIGKQPAPADFSGRYKLLWDRSRLYLLAEIVDDRLSDEYADPLLRFWEDDCLEVFLDEDGSGGLHRFNHNAFAYHVALDNQVVDYGTDRKPHVFNHHVDSAWKRSDKLTTWELAIRVYPDSYREEDDSVQPVVLQEGKRLGFMLAYCDADGDGSRQHFIGSHAIEPVNGDRNLGYIDASVFGEIELAGDAGKQPRVPVRLANIFDDGMVLQRDHPIRLWGEAASGATLDIELAGSKYTVRAGSDGRWQLELPAHAAGGPHVLALGERGRVQQVVRDILIGDVWLCSGQSNMEFPVARSPGDDGAALSEATDIRLLTVHRDSASVPLAEHRRLSGWRQADGESIREFSALCYYFARELRRTSSIPLGLIHASWGGSRIEAWLSAGGLREAGGHDEQLGLLQAWLQDEADATRRFAAGWEAWWRASAAAQGTPWIERAETRTAWKPVPVPLQDWRAFGDPALSDHQGMVWYRRSFDVDASQAAQEATLVIGGVDEVDMTWLNGKIVGTGFGWGTERRYPLPAGSLVAGRNALVANVLNTWGAGGLLGPNEDLAMLFADGTRLPLEGNWQYLQVSSDVGMPPRAPWHSLIGLTGLYNAMIAPMAGLGLSGVLWYQGESNTADADAYERLLEAWASDWRRTFDDGLRLLIVQLPGFGQLSTRPAESGWARIRDAQRRVARSDAGAGLVVTLDLGDRNDLHPPNKLAVGRRAADVARALLHDDGGVLDGLSPRRVYRRGHEVLLEFAPDAGELLVSGDRVPIAFELCCAAGAECDYASARVEGHGVVLTSPGADEASHVRYCWADATICNLYGESGIPVASFEEPIAP